MSPLSPIPPIKRRRPLVLLHPAVRKIQFLRAGSVIGSIWRKRGMARFRGRVTDPHSSAKIFYHDGRTENIGRQRIDCIRPINPIPPIPPINQLGAPSPL